MLSDNYTFCKVSSVSLVLKVYVVELKLYTEYAVTNRSTISRTWSLFFIDELNLCVKLFYNYNNLTEPTLLSIDRQNKIIYSFVPICTNNINLLDEFE